MVDELKQEDLIDNELSKEIERVEELEKLWLEEENNLMTSGNTRSVNDNGRVCRSIGKNLFNINGDVNTRYNGYTSSHNIVNDNCLTTIVNTYTTHPFGQRIYVGVGNNVTVSAILNSITFDSQPLDIDNVADIILYDDGTNLNVKHIYFNYSEIGLKKSLTFNASSNYIFVTFGRRPASTSATYSDIQVELGLISTPYEPYEGCLYGLELYDMINPNFMTDNYYINCGIIFVFLALIILIINAPLIFIRKIKGN